MESEKIEDPDYIKYLLDPKKQYDCYFVVGDASKHQPVERIGVVKKFLLAQSLVFRNELDESDLKEKSDVVVVDIFPDTFRNLLRFMYGLNNYCATLSFSEADDLLYAADKYMIESLKDSLEIRLMSLLSPDNICALMNNPVCHRLLQLNSEMNKMIQYETSQVLASTLFLDLCDSAFLSILEKDQLRAQEIELWRSAVAWAKHKSKKGFKHKTESDDGTELRVELMTHLRHIRVCTLSSEDFCKEVVCSQILTLEEILEVCLHQQSNDYQPNLKEICAVTHRRTKPPLHSKSVLLSFDISCHFRYLNETIPYTDFSVHISTQEQSIQLNSFAFYYRSFGTIPRQGDCTITLTRIDTDKTVGPISVTATVSTMFLPTFDFPVLSDDSDVILRPYSKYKVNIRSTIPLDIFYSHDQRSRYDSNDLIVHFMTDTDGKYISCIKMIYYRTVEHVWVPFSTSN